MPINPDEIRSREAAARAAIKQAYGTPDGKFSVTLFVSHHLEELEPGFWKQHLSTETPAPARVLDLLVLREHWGGDNEIDVFDFTLPDEVTNYVISVAFDENGDVFSIEMES